MHEACPGLEDLLLDSFVRPFTEKLAVGKAPSTDPESDNVVQLFKLAERTEVQNESFNVLLLVYSYFKHDILGQISADKILLTCQLLSHTLEKVLWALSNIYAEAE